MGGGSSIPEPPPPSPLFSDPWRNISWGDNQRDLQYVKDYRPEGGDINHLRVLLYGPVGAGKSSFINSVSFTLQGRVSTLRGVSSITSNKSHTKKYETHKIKKETRGNFYPFVFSDIMGLEDGSGNGVRVDDIRLVMMGHVSEGYKFNPVSALCQGEPGYNPSPSLDDKVHVLVCVLSANSAEIKESVLQKMKEIREMASDLGIPQIALITKVDEACDETEKSLRNVYKSKHVKKKMSVFSSVIGIPVNCIFPIKNYSEENSPDAFLDTLILDALRATINCGDEFLETLYITDGVSVMYMQVGQAKKEVWFARSGGTTFPLDNERNLQYVQEYQPKKVPHLRVLIYGPVGAGKSSFTNSVISVIGGRIANKAGVSATTSGKSHTKKYKTHKIRKETRGNHYPIVFSDLMGLEDGTENGVRVDDIKLALKGHVNEDYEFNPVSALSEGEPGYNPSPSLEDKVHVLVCIHSANSAEIKPVLLQKMKEIREEASDLEIPQVAVITKIDEACGETEKDLKKVYRSKHLKEKMSDFSAALGIPMNCIFLVKNYFEETSQDPDTDALILAALRSIINFGDDFLDEL